MFQRSKLTNSLFSSVSTGAVVAVVALAALGGATPAFAQGGAAEADDGKDRITVSATRRDRDILDVPIAITAITGDELEAKFQDDFADYLRQIPGVGYTNSGTLQTISIRGVSGGGGQRAKAPVSFYIDDVPVVSDPVATPDIKSFDIERVEVLRGPQGTLFGESAIGGVIRIISKQPNPNEFEAKVRASYLNVAHGGSGYNLDAVVNLPIIEDKFAIRASVSRRDESGFIDNIAPGGSEDQNDLDFWSARIKALYQASDEFSISAMAFISRSDYGGRNTADDDYEQNIFIDENRRDDIDQFNVTLKYDFGAAEIISSTSYFDRETDRLFDVTPGGGFSSFYGGELISLGILPPTYVADRAWQDLIINDESFVQELRIVSADDQRFRWVTGLYYYDTDNDVSVGFFFDPSIDPFELGRLNRQENYSQFAMFGEVEYDLMENLTFVTGLRYTNESRNIHYDQMDDWPGSFRIIPPPISIDVPVSYDIFTPKFALQYKPTDETQLYVSATKGFRGPGGNTDYNNNGVRANIYGAETIWTYELGAKARAFDSALLFEAAIFYTDWKNRQETVNPGAPFNEQYVDNIGSAEIKGVEVSTSYNIGDYITLGGQGTYIDAEVVESTSIAAVGLPVTNEPKWRGSGFADINYPLGADLSLNAHFDATYVGSAITSFTSLAERPSYELLNASIGVRGERWGVSVFAHNITDALIRFGSGVNTSINEPRVIGVSVDLAY